MVKCCCSYFADPKVIERDKRTVSSSLRSDYSMTVTWDPPIFDQVVVGVLAIIMLQYRSQIRPDTDATMTRGFTLDQVVVCAHTVHPSTSIILE
jgi:hypothetical protein